MKLILAALLLIPSYAGAQVFPYEIEDPAISRNMYFLWENILGLKKTTGAEGSFILTSSEFGGDVSGTYDNLVVMNNSHIHGIATLTGVVPSTGGVIAGDLSATGSMTASQFIGSGALLTGVIHSTTSYLADGLSLVLMGDTFSANPSSVTLKGNIFNGGNQLVLLDGDGKLPAIDGSNLSGISSVGGAGVLQLDDDGNLVPDDIVTLDSYLEVVGNDIMPLEGS